MNIQTVTGTSVWAIAAAAFSNPMYLNSPLGKTDNSVSTGFEITPGAALVIGFEGTYTGATVAHEQTMDATGVEGWFSVQGSPNTGGSATATGSTSGVAYVFTCIGVLHRIKVTALSTGTIEARIRLEGEAISTSGGGGGGGGGVLQGAVTTASPTYVDATDADFSLTLGGGVRTVLFTAAGVEVDLTAGTPGAPAGGVMSVQGVSGGTTLNVGQVTQGYDVATACTATAIAYAAQDVIGGAKDFGTLGPSAGTILITSVQLLVATGTIPSGMTSFALHLYNVTPPSAVANGDAFTLPSGDRATYLGSIALGSPVDLVDTLYVEQNGVNKQVKLAGTKLFGYLVTTGAYTSAAVDYTVTIHTVAV